MTNLSDLIGRGSCRFQANTIDPRWSSHALNEFLSSIISEGGNVGDILRSYFSMLEHLQMSAELANFSKDLAVCAFSSFQESYRNSDLQWMQDAITSGCNASQAYLALYSIPTELLNAKCIVSIFKALDGTLFWPEARVILQDETRDAELRDLLIDWIASSTQPHCLADVERLCQMHM